MLDKKVRDELLTKIDAAKSFKELIEIRNANHLILHGSFEIPYEVKSEAFNKIKQVDSVVANILEEQYTEKDTSFGYYFFNLSKVIFQLLVNYSTLNIIDSNNLIFLNLDAKLTQCVQAALKHLFPAVFFPKLTINDKAINFENRLSFSEVALGFYAQLFDHLSKNTEALQQDIKSSHIKIPHEENINNFIVTIIKNLHQQLPNNHYNSFSLDQSNKKIISASDLVQGKALGYLIFINFLSGKTQVSLKEFSEHLEKLDGISEEIEELSGTVKKPSQQDTNTHSNKRKQADLENMSTQPAGKYANFRSKPKVKLPQPAPVPVSKEDIAQEPMEKESVHKGQIKIIENLGATTTFNELSKGFSKEEFFFHPSTENLLKESISDIAYNIENINEIIGEENKYIEISVENSFFINYFFKLSQVISQRIVLFSTIKFAKDASLADITPEYNKKLFHSVFLSNAVGEISQGNMHQRALGHYLIVAVYFYIHLCNLIKKYPKLLEAKIKPFKFSTRRSADSLLFIKEIIGNYKETLSNENKTYVRYEQSNGPSRTGYSDVLNGVTLAHLFCTTQLNLHDLGIKKEDIFNDLKTVRAPLVEKMMTKIDEEAAKIQQKKMLKEEGNINSPSSNASSSSSAARSDSEPSPPQKMDNSKRVE